MSRAGQRQSELVAAVVSIVLGLASSAAYDGIKVAIAALAKKNDVTVEDEREEEAEGK